MDRRVQNADPPAGTPIPAASAARRDQPSRLPGAVASLMRSARRPRFRAGLIALGIAAVMGLFAAGHLYSSPYVDPSLLLYPISLALAWCGEGWLHDRTAPARTRAAVAGIGVYRAELLLLVVITLAGGALRFWMAHQYVLLHGTVSDEVVVGQQAWDMMRGNNPWPLYTLSGGAVGFYQPIAAAFLFFGATMEHLRDLLVLESVFLIPSFYLLGRQFVSAPPALCATALLALAYWPAIMGVLAFGWLLGATFQCLGFALLAYGTRRCSLTACLGGGMVLALCLYSYIGHRVMPLPAAPFMLLFAWRGADALRRRLVLAAGSAIGFALVAAPWIGSVLSNSDLLYGDTRFVTNSFQAEFGIQPLSALHDALAVAGRLAMTIVVRPRSTDFSVLVMPDGGLLDPVLAVLVGLGGVYVAARFWRPAHVLVLCAVIPPFFFASVAIGFVDTYRLNSIIPALFLAVALVLERGLRSLRHFPQGARVVPAILLVITVWSGVNNLRAASAQFTGCGMAEGNNGPLTIDNGEPYLVAEAANAQDVRQAVFLVSSPHHFPPGDWAWLISRPLPVYNPTPGGTDPADWPLLSQPEGQAPSANLPTFWPPRPAPGQRGITYLMTDDDAARFLPLVRRAYPGGLTRVWRAEECPSYTVTTYALSASRLPRATRAGMGE